MSLLPIDPDRAPARPFSLPATGDLFRIAGAVGPEAANARDDVIRAQILLGRTGDLDLDSLGGPTGWPGSELTRGLRRYQRRKGLTVDGLMLPDGETITALQKDLFDSLADYRAPTTAEVDGFHDRLARYRADGSEDVEPPRMQLERPDGRTPPYALTIARDRPLIESLPRAGVKSDVDVVAPAGFIPGAQVAQLAEGMMMQAQAAATNTAASAGAAGTAGAADTSKRPPPGVTPDIDKVGRQLGKSFDEKVNLLAAPVHLLNALNTGTPPFNAVDSATEAATKTPPLKPSAPEERPPEGSKAEEREPTLEELIPPEMKPWVEGLEPFDQQLARELMLIYNRRGGPETIKGNAIVVKVFLDTIKKYPVLADSIEHVGGSHSPKDGQPGDTAEETYQKELYFRNTETEGRKGSSWADISFRIKEALSKELGIEYWHLSTAELKPNGEPIDDEIEKGTRLGKNSKKSRVNYVEKPIPGRINGQKIPYDWESYQARVKDLAERLVEELDAMRAHGKP
jgi:hypothetical protein